MITMRCLVASRRAADDLLDGVEQFVAGCGDGTLSAVRPWRRAPLLEVTWRTLHPRPAIGRVTLFIDSIRTVRQLDGPDGTPLDRCVAVAPEGLDAEDVQLSWALVRILLRRRRCAVWLDARGFLPAPLKPDCSFAVLPLPIGSEQGFVLGADDIIALLRACR